MNGKLTALLHRARGLRDKLREEGRHHEAEVLQSLIRSRESANGLNSQLHRELTELREARSLDDPKSAKAATEERTPPC